MFALVSIVLISAGTLLACLAEGLLPRLSVADRFRPGLSCAGGILLVLGFGSIGLGLSLRG